MLVAIRGSVRSCGCGCPNRETRRYYRAADVSFCVVVSVTFLREIDEKERKKGSFVVDGVTWKYSLRRAPVVIVMFLFFVVVVSTPKREFLVKFIVYIFFVVAVVVFVAVRLCEKIKRKKNKFCACNCKIVTPKYIVEKTCYFINKISCLPPLVKTTVWRQWARGSSTSTR